MNRLILVAHQSSGYRHKAEVRMTDHDSRRMSTLSLNHIRAINGHRIPVSVILESSGGRPPGVIVAVPNEMPGRNPTKQANVVVYFWIIRK